MTDTQEQLSAWRALILSPREKRLLRRFAKGMTDEKIARDIGGTEKQVAGARTSLIVKLEIRSHEHFVFAADQLARWPMRVEK